MSAQLGDELSARIVGAVDRDRLVATAKELVGIPSPTGSEFAMGLAVRDLLAARGLRINWQQVEDERANVLGLWEGTGGGKSLMFNGHMDTSYSGNEPHLQGVGFRPEAVERDGHIFGLGISNMKGALAAYIECVRALQDAGVRLRGDLVIACVIGEIEKTQWGEEFRGAAYRGYSTGSRVVGAYGGTADMCILGEPTGQRVVLAHFGALWARISVRGPFVHTAFSRGRLSENSILRMQEVVRRVVDWIPTWEKRATYGDLPGLVSVGAIRGGQPWRVSRTPERTDLFLDIRVPPNMRMQEASDAFRDLVRALRAELGEELIDWEVYVTAPGAEIEESHPLIAAVDDSHEAVFGEVPERSVEHWFSDASSLTRYGIPSVNYGTSVGLPGAEGENLAIDGLVDITRVYALSAARICGVAE